MTTKRTFLATTCTVLALLVVGVSSPSQAQDTVELTYTTFLDPANNTDPRVAAQTKLLKTFEEKNPGIKVKVLVDPTSANLSRGFKSRSGSPDVGRIPSYSLPELTLTGSVEPLDDLIAKEKIDENDWLLPLPQTRFNGKYYGLPQDFRIPLLMYRKSILEKAGVPVPKTWSEVCEAGPKLTQGNVIGYAVPLGASGGLGGAQALGEYTLSTILAPDGKYFTDNGRDIAFSKETLIRAAQTIKDLYGKCGATPQTSVQFGYNEVHDGLRAGTIAMSTFGLARFRAIKAQGAGEDLQWAPAPGFSPDDKQTVFGFRVVLNAHSPHKEEAWKLIKFVTSTEGQEIQAEGGEVVARASAYKSAYFSKPEAANQKAWAELVRSKGQVVAYSVALTKFHEIVGEALQRLVLRDGDAETAYDEIVKRYSRELKKIN